jgi:hypothetical protein
MDWLLTEKQSSTFIEFSTVSALSSHQIEPVKCLFIDEMQNQVSVPPVP